MELTWFRQPADDDPGSLNLCFNALDIHVVRGRAEEPAVLGRSELDFATVLERASTLGGVLTALGVGIGDRVGVQRTDPLDDVLLLLACLRIGAVYAELPGAGECAVEITDEHDLGAAEKAGRQAPAPCAPLPPDAVAFESDGEPVRLLEAPSHSSVQGMIVRSLCAGSAVAVATGTAL